MGPVPGVALLQGLVDLVLPLIVLSINGDLQKGFPLPPISGVNFTDTSGLRLMDGFAQLSANFSFAYPGL